MTVYVVFADRHREGGELRAVCASTKLAADFIQAELADKLKHGIRDGAYEPEDYRIEPEELIEGAADIAARAIK